MGSVFRLRASIEESRPEVDFTRLDSSTMSWEPIVAGSATISLSLTSQGGGEWDYFAVPGTLGAASLRLGKFLEEHADGSVLLRPIRVSGEPFFLVVVGQPKDWFDHERASFEVFDVNPSRIMNVLRYAFRPAASAGTTVFTVPDLNNQLFASQQAVADLQARGIRGLRCLKVSEN